MNSLWRWLVLGCCLAALVHPAALAAQPAGPLYVLRLDGVVTSVSAGYLQRGLRQAEAASATALIIELRAEGGVLRVLRALAHDIHEARVPVVVYVAPGSAAGAGGALLLSAAHVAAMAPDSSFGSAYPLAQLDRVLAEETRALLLDDLSLQLRRWNNERGRGSAWVDQGVRQGLIVSSAQASAERPPAIDIVAPQLEDLPTLLEGRQVTLADGRQQQLHTLGLVLQAIDPTPWEALRLLLANPTLAFLLFVLGGIALYCELAAPGTSVFAGIGVVLLAAALAGLLVLPLRPLSLAGLLLAFGLLAADLFVPSHGGLTVAGLALLIVAALTLIDPVEAPAAQVAIWAVAVVALALATLLGLGLWLALKARRRPVVGGSAGLLGLMAEVRQPLDPEGMVFVDGALWQAVSSAGPIDKGAWVRVVAVERLRLIVQALE